MSFHTSVSEVQDGVVNLRGFSLAQLMTSVTYTEGAFLSIVGRFPSPQETDLVDTMLNSLLDHGFVASTITAARYIASGNPQFIPAVSGGLLAAGSNTLSPEHSFALVKRGLELKAENGERLDAAADSVVAEYQSSGRRLPGFGHPVHKSGDFRAEILLERARQLGLAGEGVGMFTAIDTAFARRRSGGRIPINVDGALAAVGFDLGWNADQTVAFAVLSVLPGLMGHVIEELTSGKPLRYIEDGEYAGEALTTIPTDFYSARRRLNEPAK